MTPAFLVVALHMANHAFALVLLPLCQFVPTPFERVVTPPKQQSYRRALQFERVNKTVFKIAPIGVWHCVGLTAVDHNGGWMVTTRMSITKLDPPAAN